MLSLLVSLQLLMVTGSSSLAQDSGRGTFGTDEDFTISYDRLELDVSTEDGGRSFVVLGNVVLEGRGFSLRADAIGVFVDGVDPRTGPIHPRSYWREVSSHFEPARSSWMLNRARWCSRRRNFV